jgi:hypothetical protein
MHSATIYAIYWSPAGTTTSANYQSTISQYLTDVAAASGTTNNVYATLSQYYDVAGGVTTNIAYNIHVGGSFVDTTTYPTGGCPVSYSATTSCVTDAQIAAEIKSVIASQGWNTSPDDSKLFVLLTPKNVGACYNAS